MIRRMQSPTNKINDIPNEEPKGGGLPALRLVYILPSANTIQAHHARPIRK